MIGGTGENLLKAKVFVTRKWTQSAQKAQQLWNSFKDRLERFFRAEGDNNFRG